MVEGFSIVNVEQIRDDLRKWKVREVLESLDIAKDKVEILKKLLTDKNETVVGNTLFVIERLIKDGKLDSEQTEELLDTIIRLSKSSNDKIALNSLKCLRTILDNVQLSNQGYDKVINTLSGIITSRRGILREYAAEELGILGAKITSFIKRIVEFLVSLIKEGKDREVKGAALSALTEIASRSDNVEVIEDITREIREFIKTEQDAELKKKAISSLEIIFSKKRDKLTPKTMSEIKEEVPEIDKSTEVPYEENVDIEKLFEMEKHEVVATLAKENEGILKKVVEMLSSKEYIRRADALWVIARIIKFLDPNMARYVVKNLAGLVKDRNPWIRNTAIKAIAEAYVLYPEVRMDVIPLLDALLRSNNKEDVELALNIIKEILSYSHDEELFRATLILTIKKLDDKSIRPVILGFYALVADNFLNVDTELIRVLIGKLNEIYKDLTQDEKKIASSLIDLLTTILKGRERR
ncbi:HEAT repeat domain-containing protein [Pyrococcus abyssi]|uniref:Clathrin/coatomer adaptor adaptin-like N-terminal domain-containing protein n=1 Tax=Pyrococcus abyssi (strain GE5 / Orsay) TaxID=272844 RepID=Q9V0Z0_PYRAB|nr:hypothetical protein [Pyrococcus abyssi]CAB49561.1 Hypothetical protein PAB1939 [Pyrococcus abyssi GE5]CCE70033.1 TPA: hypothetical protein PAB1939 [Pyrococcus abyssi GE5]